MAAAINWQHSCCEWITFMLITQSFENPPWNDDFSLLLGLFFKSDFCLLYLELKRWSMRLCCLCSSQHSGELVPELCWIQLYRKTNGEVVLEPTVLRTSVREPSWCFSLCIGYFCRPLHCSTRLILVHAEERTCSSRCKPVQPARDRGLGANLLNRDYSQEAALSASHLLILS